MATHLDLQEQEQLDALKSFWKQYGNLVTWTLVLALAAYAAWNGWQWFQRDQAMKAGALYDALELSAQQGDLERVASRAVDLKEKYGGTAYAAQGALLAARVQAERGQDDAARESLAWVAEHAGDDALRAVARLRLAALQMQARQYDAALKTLDAAPPAGFEALTADRRGDVLMAMGRTADARAAWTTAWRAMDERLEYRQLVDAKLTSIGAAPSASASAPATAGGVQ